MSTPATPSACKYPDSLFPLIVDTTSVSISNSSVQSLVQKYLTCGWEQWAGLVGVVLLCFCCLFMVVLL